MDKDPFKEYIRESEPKKRDKGYARIAALLSERAFSFTPNEYLSIHRKLFNGIYSHAGRIRDYNITKKEWVLNGAMAALRRLGRRLIMIFLRKRSFPIKISQWMKSSTIWPHNSKSYFEAS